MQILLLTLAASWAVNAYARKEERVPIPTVTISNGVVVGTSNPLDGQDRFLGVPFALPPTGDRRLRAPQTLTSAFGTLTATVSPSGCPQLGGQTTPAGLSSTVTAPIATGSPNVFDFLSTQHNTVEDCLYLNIQRPSGTNSTSRLPVLAWIFGGGFETGSTSGYDNNLMLSKAMSLGAPYVFVAMNYRVAAFGFLAGKELSSENNTNLGLQDQRLALQWIADNIAAFGGDPAKVTIWGESAGAWSVMDQTIINGGDNTYKGKPLFRAAMMNSGATLPALDVRDPKPQAVFDNLARDAGCGTASDVLTCLRNVDYNTFLTAQNNQASKYPAASLSYLARPDSASTFFSTSPEVAVMQGRYAKVPIISGNQQDEGALFAVTITGVDGNDDSQLLGLLNPVFPDALDTTLLALVDTYPKNVSAGCPYNTGILNEIYPGYKRLGAIIGDTVFILARRMYLDAVSNTVKAWSYSSDYDQGTPILGTCHATDILAMYYGIAPTVATNELWTRYISFINFNDPNTFGLRQSTTYQQWFQYDSVGRHLLDFDAGGVSNSLDTFRMNSYAVLTSNETSFRM